MFHCPYDIRIYTTYISPEVKQVLTKRKIKMPGEPLVCVWEAAHSATSKSNLTISLLKEVTSQFQDLPCVDYSEVKFESALSNHEVRFTDYKSYVHTVLRKANTPLLALLEQIEKKCWNLCKNRYISNYTSENVVEMVWQIFNRYADESTFPAVVPKERALLFLNNLCNKISIKIKKNKLSVEKNVTFSMMLKILDDAIFSQTDILTYETAIRNFNKNVTKNIVKCGWMFHRCKNMSNWTGWSKRWFVLTPGKLLFYTKGCCTDPDGSSLKGEVFITSKSQLEPLAPCNGAFRKYLGCFKITISHLQREIEMAAGGEIERKFWMEAISEMTNSDSIEKNKNLPRPTVVVEIHRHEKHDETSEPANETSEPQNVVTLEEEKLKVIFMKIDKDGNGFIDERELLAFFGQLQLSLSEADVKQIFQRIDSDKSGAISFEEFARYFERVIIQEDNGDSVDNKLRAAFLSADHDGSGTINFKEFAEYVWEKKRSVRMSKLLTTFNKMEKNNNGEVPFDKFRQCFEQEIEDLGMIPEENENTESDTTNNLNQMLKCLYDETDSEELAVFIKDRWKTFASFKRFGASGEIVMKGSHDMVADFTPGEYSLVDLACFSDVPPIEPKHTIVKGVQWISGTEAGQSGKCIFPAYFDGKIISDIATNETLRYYDCSFANGNQVKVSLLHRHGIQDFTYENKYLEDYVKNQNGGSGIERHQFSHLDCPLEEDSGYFILGRFHTKNELHLTAFRIPVRHTLYIPGGVMHTNDYLKGKWRTMLSDESHIDHVHLMQPKTKTSYKHFTFTFV